MYKILIDACDIIVTLLRIHQETCLECYFIEIRWYASEYYVYSLIELSRLEKTLIKGMLKKIKFGVLGFSSIITTICFKALSQ